MKYLDGEDTIDVVFKKVHEFKSDNARVAMAGEGDLPSLAKKKVSFRDMRDLIRGAFDASISSWLMPWCLSVPVRFWRFRLFLPPGRWSRYAYPCWGSSLTFPARRSRVKTTGIWKASPKPKIRIMLKPRYSLARA